jgi:diguanylate cyclase
MGPDEEGLTADTAAEYLRMIVPLMSQHAIPATPENYAVWFAHVSGENSELSAEIEDLIAKKQEFTAEVCRKLHKSLLSEDVADTIEHVRHSLDDMLIEIGVSLQGAGKDAAQYAGTLGGAVEHLGRVDSLQDIRDLLNTLIVETRSIRRATTDLHADFDIKTKEIEELHEQLRNERKRATTDALTGLPNRAALMEKLNRAATETDELGPLSIIMIDIDHFKEVNDQHGHLIGDRVIRFVAQILLKNIKGQDTAARYGGEEFMLLLPRTGTRGAHSVAESIRSAVSNAQLVRADNKQPLGQITLSAGVGTLLANEDIMDLINRADQALYKAKRDGRNRVKTAA